MPQNTKTKLVQLCYQYSRMYCRTKIIAKNVTTCFLNDLKLQKTKMTELEIEFDRSITVMAIDR